MTGAAVMWSHCRNRQQVFGALIHIFHSIFPVQFAVVGNYRTPDELDMMIVSLGEILASGWVYSIHL
jgi:hypothetical protein